MTATPCARCTATAAVFTATEPLCRYCRRGAELTDTLYMVTTKRPWREDGTAGVHTRTTLYRYERCDYTAVYFTAEGVLAEDGAPRTFAGTPTALSTTWAGFQARLASGEWQTVTDADKPYDTDKELFMNALGALMASLMDDEYDTDHCENAR